MQYLMLFKYRDVSMYYMFKLYGDFEIGSLWAFIFYFVLFVVLVLAKTSLPFFSFMSSRYPKMSEDEIAESCPVCRGNCNCKSCLRMEGVIAVSFAHHAQFFC